MFFMMFYCLPNSSENLLFIVNIVNISTDIWCVHCLSETFVFASLPLILAGFAIMTKIANYVSLMYFKAKMLESKQ